MYGIEQKNHLGGYIINYSEVGDPNTYDINVWNYMKNDGIKSVIDIGCGMGYSTKWFVDNGIESLGIEGGEKAVKNSLCPNNVVMHDFTEGVYTPKRKYDAVWCCEFVEHVEEKYMNNFLETFKYAEKIFMTHAKPGQVGYHHVNCRNSDYWISNVEKIGFSYDSSNTEYLRRLSNCMHIKNNLLVFRKFSD